MAMERFHWTSEGMQIADDDDPRYTNWVRYEAAQALEAALTAEREARRRLVGFAQHQDHCPAADTFWTARSIHLEDHDEPDFAACDDDTCIAWAQAGEDGNVACVCGLADELAVLDAEKERKPHIDDGEPIANDDGDFNHESDAD